MPLPASPGRKISGIYATLLDLLQPESFAAGCSALASWNDDDRLAAMLLCQMHGIAPLLHTRFKASGISTRCAPEFIDYLATQYGACKSRARRISEIQQQLTQPFADDNRDLLLLKGCQLLSACYPDPALRPMADIDVLIRAENRPLLEAVTDRLGLRLYSETADGASYLTSAAMSGIEDANEGMFVSEDARELYVYERADAPIAVDVHFRVTRSLQFAVIDLTESLRREGQEGRLGAAAMAHLVLHNVQNLIEHRCRLIQLYDVYLLAQQLNEKDWNELAQLSRQWRMAYQFSLVFLLAGRLFSDQPAGLSQWLPFQDMRVMGVDVRQFSMRFSYANPEPVRLRDLLSLCDGLEQKKTVLAYKLNARHPHRSQYRFASAVARSQRSSNVLARGYHYFFKRGNRAGFRGFEMHGFSADQVW